MQSLGNCFPLVAVDIGNSRIKLGRFAAAEPRGLPAPQDTLTLDPDWRPEHLDAWLPEAGTRSAWLIASVQRASAARLMEALRRRPGADSRLLAHTDLPLAIDVERPERVGIDRLVSAVAANRLRTPGRAAIVADLGSALTVDAISADGTFLGGAIGPGIAMAAQALHQFTDLLPLVPLAELAEPPPALGRATDAALRSGLYWGAVGAMRELIARLCSELGLAEPHVFLTGGAAPVVARLVDPQATYVPHLTLAGIAIVAGG